MLNLRNYKSIEINNGMGCVQRFALGQNKSGRDQIFFDRREVENVNALVVKFAIVKNLPDFLPALVCSFKNIRN